MTGFIFLYWKDNLIFVLEAFFCEQKVFIFPEVRFSNYTQLSFSVFIEETKVNAVREDILWLFWNSIWSEIRSNLSFPFSRYWIQLKRNEVKRKNTTKRKTFALNCQKQISNRTPKAFFPCCGWITYAVLYINLTLII